MYALKPIQFHFFGSKVFLSVSNMHTFFCKNSSKIILFDISELLPSLTKGKKIELTGKCVFQQKVTDTEELLTEFQQWASKFPMDLVDQVD